MAPLTPAQRKRQMRKRRVIAAANRAALVMCIVFATIGFTLAWLWVLIRPK